MQLDVDLEIRKCFKRLRNHDPQVYDRLLRLVDHRNYEVTVAVTEAAPDQILVAQGRAREARKFWLLLTELPEDDPVQPSPGP